MKEKIKFWIKRLCNWRFLICFGIAWIITNGWAYVFIAVGTSCSIKWMLAVGTSYMAFLWLPITPEKLITIPIAIFLLKILFPKSKELQKQLEEEKNNLKKELKSKKK